MESFARGWNFLTQSWKMALADNDLIKPSVYALFAGFLFSIVGIIPMALVFFIFGNAGRFGEAVLVIMGALIAFGEYAITYIFSAMTVYLIYGYISEGDGRMDKAWQLVRRDWMDILSLAAASTVVNLIRDWVKGRQGRGGRNPLREALAGLIDTVWTEATYLVLPIMVIEDVNLKDGLQRATYIAKNNLLLVGVSMVGVKAVTGLISFVFVAVGVSLGFGIAYPFISLGGDAIVVMVAGIALGVLVASVFIMAASIISSYTSTAYHTCLYLWARDVERAGQGHSVAAPAPLAAVLGNTYATN